MSELFDQIREEAIEKRKQDKINLIYDLSNPQFWEHYGDTSYTYYFFDPYGTLERLQLSFYGMKEIMKKHFNKLLLKWEFILPHTKEAMFIFRFSKFPYDEKLDRLITDLSNPKNWIHAAMYREYYTDPNKTLKDANLSDEKIIDIISDTLNKHVQYIEREQGYYLFRF